jgi:hypothetical protein
VPCQAGVRARLDTTPRALAAVCGRRGSQPSSSGGTGNAGGATANPGPVQASRDVSFSIKGSRPHDVLRCVEFVTGESEDGLGVLAPVVVEGVLVVRHHPAWGQFSAVEEVLVQEARRVR